MSLHEYRVSRQISEQGYPFYALIMAAMRQADGPNLTMLKTMFPLVWEELKERYNLPGGAYPNDEFDGPPSPLRDLIPAERNDAYAPPPMDPRLAALLPDESEGL